MLDKLLNPQILTLLLKPDEPDYWIETLKEDGERVLKIYSDFNVTIDDLSDKYTDYILNAVRRNGTSSFLFEMFAQLVGNQERIADAILEDGSDPENEVAIFALKSLPIIVREVIKFCSRIYNIGTSSECTAIRNIALNDNDFNKDTNINNLILREFFKTDLIESQVNYFYYVFDNCIEEFTAENQSCKNFNHDKFLRSNDCSNGNLNLLQFEEAYASTCNVCPLLCNLANDNKVVKVNKHVTEPTRDLIYSTGLLISILFLVLTLVIFAVLPILRRNVHGKCTLFHLMSMTAAYSCLALVQLHSPQYHICQIIGHIMQFGFLAMFFWLNVMCFDIMLAFCFLRNRKKQARDKQLDVNKLIWYCSYGWGGPTLILAITLLMEYSHILDEDYYDFKPEIGGPKCFFLNVKTQWLFLYGPIGCLILANLIMFGITALMIYSHSKSCDVLQSSENSVTTRSDNTRLKVYINLFILMGANWATEALSWTLPGNKWFSYLTDITTTLQGLFVFVLFVCKPRVIRELRMKLGCLNGSREIPKYKTSVSSDKSTEQTTT